MMKMTPILGFLMSLDGLGFEGAGGAGGEFDGVFGAGFFGVLFEGQLDELVDELGEGDAGGFPEFGVHADGSETGNGVHFVEIDFPAVFFEEEIHASHAVEFEGAKGFDRVLLEFFDFHGFEFGGNQKLRAFFEVFGGVVVELAVRDDFAGDGGLRVAIAEHGDFDFAGVDSELDHDFHGEFGGEMESGRELVVRVNLRHADGGAERGGLDENGIGERFFDFVRGLDGMALPVVAANGQPGHDRNFCGAQKFFGDILVHGDGRAEDARADEGETGEIEKALDGPIFAEGAVHDGEHHVETLAAAAAIEADERGVGGVGGHSDALAGAQNFREHFLRAGADEPVAFLGDADGHGFVFVGVEAANDGSGGGERDFMFARAAAEEDTDAEAFFVRAHGSR